MSDLDMMMAVRAMRRPAFLTGELAVGSGRSASATVQALSRLERAGLVLKVCRGVWADSANGALSPYSVIPYLFPRNRAYVSFISALHLYGIIEQIPQVITLAAAIHTKTIRTRVGTFFVHQIAPTFFKGFDWYKKEGSFLIAEPEKALIDCLYVSVRRKNQFSHFPELRFSPKFSFSKARGWAGKVPDSNTKKHVLARLEEILKTRNRLNDMEVLK